MGECGCNELKAAEGLRLGEHVLAVEKYRGCRDCGSGVGVTVHLMTPEQAAEFEVPITGALDSGTRGWDQRHYPLFGADDLARAAEALDGHEGIDLSRYDSLADLLRDHGLRLLQGAMRQHELSERPGARPAAEDPPG